MASRYWVGGSGTWSGFNTANWSTTSGGPGGASVPNTGDDVFFDANSGGGVVTGFLSVGTFDLRGFTGSFSISSSQTAAFGPGTSYLSSTVAGLSDLNLKGASGGSAILYGDGATVRNLSGEIVFASDVTAYLLIGSDSLGDDLTVNSGVTVTAAAIVAYESRFVCKGAGKIRLTGRSGASIISVGQLYATTVFSVDCLIEVVGVSSTETLYFGTGTYSYGASAEIRFVKSGVTYSIEAPGLSSSSVLPTLHLYPESSGYVLVQLMRNYDVHCKTLKSTAGSSGGQNFFVSDAGSILPTSQAQVVTYSAGSDFNNVNLRNIAASGQPISGTRLGDLGGNSGVTLSVPSNVYRIAVGSYDAANSWSTSSGGAANSGIPLPQDVAVFDANTPVGTITIAGGINYFFSTQSYIGGFDASAYTGTISFSSSTFITTSDQAVFGSSTTLSMSNNTLTSHSTSAVQVQCPNGGLRLSCDSASLTSASNLTLTVTGAVTTNNYAHTMRLTLGSAATANFGSSAITFTGSGLVVPASATLNAGSATFTTSGATEISLNGKTLPNLTVSSATSFTTNATITSLTHSAGNISVTAAVTLTATAYTSPAPLATPPSLKCTTVGSTFTFNTSGAKVLQNLNLQGVDVTGTTYWNALNCINGGYNDAYILFNNNAGAIALF